MNTLLYLQREKALKIAVAFKDQLSKELIRIENRQTLIKTSNIFSKVRKIAC